MNRKLFTLIFSIAFTFITVLGSFSAISVSANTIYISDDDYSHSKDILGVICPEMPLSDSEVTTRADFVATVAMLFKATKAPKGTETGFSDVPKTHEYSSYIAFAKNAGLISTVDLFYPDSPITYNQAIKILMCAAGYGERAEQTGGFPSGYLMAAKDANVGQMITASETDSLTHSEAIELIFEAVIADMMEVTSWGDSFDYSVTPGKNILSLYHKIYIANGVVDANENTTLIDSVSNLGDNTIRINGKTFYAPGYATLIGKNARVFYNAESKNNVLYAYENENMSYEYTHEDDIKISGTKLTVSPKDGTKDVNYNLKLGYSVLLNGKWYGSADYNTTVNPTSGYVTLVDNNRDNVIDVIIVKDIEYGVVGTVNEFDGKIYDKYKKNGITVFSDASTKYSLTRSDGTVVTIDELEEDNCIGIAASKDGLLYEIIHYTNRVGGTYNSRTDNEIIINGNKYKLSNYYINNIKAIDKIKFGSDVILHLGEGNQVIYVQEFSTSLKYGFLIATEQLEGIDKTVNVKLYSQDGTMHALQAADNLKVNGAKPVSVINSLDEIIAKELPLRVIKFSLNADGKLSAIWSAVKNNSGAAALMTATVDEASPVLYSLNASSEQGSTANEGKLMYKSGTFYPLFHLGSGAGVVQVPINEGFRLSDDYYSTYTQTALNSATDGTENQYFYGYDVHNGNAAFVLWTKDGSGATEVGEGGSAIIEAVTEGVNEEGQAVKVFKAYMNKTWTKFYSKAEYNSTESGLEATVNSLKPGDIAQIALNSDNEITAASINFSFIGDSTNGPRYTNPKNKNDKYSAKVVGFESGYILTNANKKTMLARDVEMSDIESGNYSIINTVATPISGTVVFVKFNYERGTTDIASAEVYTEKDVSVAESYFTAGKDADYLVQRSRYNAPSLTVIYTNGPID